MTAGLLPNDSCTALRKIGPRQNLLLASLPARAFERLLPHLESVPMLLGEVLLDDHEFAYFPSTAIISLVQATEAGASSEVAMVGRDGMCGISVFTGGSRPGSRAIVHCAGAGYRLRADLLKAEFSQPGPFRVLMLRYAQVRMAQIAQTAVCYRHHSVEQQVCRRLLMSLDRLISTEVPVTHELMAATLGVRREAVTLATCRLQSEGLITCSRGRISLLDRAKVEARSCECYRALNKEVARLLPLGAPSARVA